MVFQCLLFRERSVNLLKKQYIGCAWILNVQNPGALIFSQLWLASKVAQLQEKAQLR